MQQKAEGAWSLEPAGGHTSESQNTVPSVCHSFGTFIAFTDAPNKRPRTFFVSINLYLLIPHARYMS